MSVAVDIFVVSCKAVLKVFIIGGVGCFARRRGLLDEDSCRKMAKLNGAVFLPCLLFVALGRSVTIDHLRNVWLLPLSACVNIALGAVMGKALVRALGTPPEFRGAAVASAAFGNSLALPVCSSPPSSARATWATCRSARTRRRSPSCTLART